MPSDWSLHSRLGALVKEHQLAFVNQRNRQKDVTCCTHYRTLWLRQLPFDDSHWNFDNRLSVESGHTNIDADQSIPILASSQIALAMAQVISPAGIRLRIRPSKVHIHTLELSWFDYKVLGIRKKHTSVQY